jgi:1-acyl-sn-glycerol-3-phosphate acyltransferase
VHPLLLIIYYLYKGLVLLAGRFFYENITIANPQYRRFDNPCILISNHPSTALDPLNTAVRVNAKVFFLANASLFKTRFTNWFFNTFYCIPIERQQDTNGRPLDNAASFERASLHLAGGGCLYIAPEGSSFVERRLRKIKTGTSRISLAAEQRNNFELGLTIQPVGLNYSDPTRFRSRLLLIFGPPIKVADFRPAPGEDDFSAVQRLTAAVETALANLLINCQDEAEDHRLAVLECMLQNEQPLPPLEAFQRTRAALARLHAWKADAPAAASSFEEKLDAYAGQLQQLQTADANIKGSTLPVLTTCLQLLATLPLFLAGLLLHLPATWTAGQLSNHLNKDKHWVPTYKFLAGIVFYLFFLGIQCWIAGGLAGATGVLALLALFYPLGLVADWWLGKWQALATHFRTAALKKKQPEVWRKLTEERTQLLSAARASLL